jgi:endonuclease-3 related protein
VPRFAQAIPLILAAADARPSGPWPEVGTFAAVVAAYLGCWADDRVVLAALEALRESGSLAPDSLSGADPAEIQETLRSGGAKSLVKLVPAIQRIAAWAAGTFKTETDGRLDAETPTEALRDGLRALKGVGATTADAILLNGLGRPAFPVDRATYRVLVRHGWLDATADYDEARSFVEAAAPDDAATLARLAAGLERLGKETCRTGVPRCERCPLRPLLPEGGPLGDS